MADIKELKRKADILSVLERVGARTGYPGQAWVEEIYVYCPFCEDRDSSKPAGRANIVKQLYHCFNCGFGGDSITLAKQYTGGDFRQAVAWLEDEFGVEDEPR